MKQLSIILPVYKVEAYLERCLKSIIEQDIPSDDYEVIIVNDGSPDKSRDIVLAFQQNYFNIILIDQENKGVSDARNHGLEIAVGKYILFIDPDDYIEANSLSGSIKLAEKDCLDVLYLGFEEWDIYGNYLGNNDYSHLAGEVFSGIETYRNTRGKKMKTPDRSVGILLKNSLLTSGNLLYTPDVPYLQDGLFVGKVLCFAKRCGFSNKQFYKYIKRPGSSSTTHRGLTEKGISGFVIGALDLKDFRNSHQFDPQQIELLNHLTAKYVLSPIMYSVSIRSLKMLKNVKLKFKRNGLVKLNKSGLIGLKVYATLYNFSFWLFVIYFIIKTRWEKALSLVKGS